MQIASVLVALAGDNGNTVTKTNVTPSEIAVLQRIHGPDAVSEITIIGEVTRTDRAERARLSEAYGKASVNNEFQSPVVDQIFPGIAARMFQTFAELELADQQFAREQDVIAAAPAEAAQPEVAAEPAPAPAPKRSKKAAAEPAPAPEPVAEPDEDDGIEEMPDAGLFGEK